MSKMEKKESRFLLIGFQYWFVIIIVVATAVWSNVFSFELWGGAEGLVHQIKLHGYDSYFDEPDLVMSFWEVFHDKDDGDALLDAPLIDKIYRIEILFVVVPFLIASIVFPRVKQKKWRIVGGLLLGVLVICLQLQYGYMWYDVWLTHPDAKVESHVWHFILLFGGGGLIYAVTYGLSLYSSYKIMMKSRQEDEKKKVLLLSNLWSLISFLIVFAVVAFGLEGYVIFVALAFVLAFVLCIVSFFV